jgi:hypothetical protein
MIHNMKKLLLFCSVIFATFTAKADPWDDLTVTQAKAVVAFLKKNPFVLDYCDCCENPEVSLIKIVKAEIIPCEWNPQKVSVRALSWTIGKLEVYSDTPSAYRTQPQMTPTDYLITMNYTFVYSKAGKWAVPFFKEVPYDRDHVCKGATNFPNPKDNPGITDLDYIKWYKKKIGK